MKKGMHLLAGILVASFLGSSCSNTQKKDSTKAENQIVFACTDSTTMEDNGMKLTWIKDNAKERIMPLSLFGNIPQQLADSLNIQNGILASISTFLLETDGKRVLFDTGMGAPDSRLQSGLAAVGLSPADIDYIFLTHFHGDHIGGMMQGDSIVFPNAEVYAAKQEYDGWMQMPNKQKAQVVKTMDAYKNRLHLFEYGDTIPCKIITMNGEGHTPGHTIYQAGKFLIIGDLIHGAALQLAHPEICASYDMNPQKAIQSRKQYLEYAHQNGLIMAGMHQPANKAK